MAEPWGCPKGCVQVPRASTRGTATFASRTRETDSNMQEPNNEMPGERGTFLLAFPGEVVGRWRVIFNHKVTKDTEFF